MTVRPGQTRCGCRLCQRVIVRRRNKLRRKREKKFDENFEISEIVDLVTSIHNSANLPEEYIEVSSPAWLTPRSCSIVLPDEHVVWKNHLAVPWLVESVVNHGIFICLSGLLHELTVMPLGGLKCAWRMFLGAPTSVSQKSDLVRFAILCTACVIFQSLVDFSGVYHYIRAQSLLKVYFIFNMLEIIERLVRSWGNEIVERMLACIDEHPLQLLGYSVGTLLYTLVHCYMHFWRVMLVSVAIVSTDSSMFMIVLTNNFAELKGTVFKKYDARSLYPAVGSDIVERVYLFMDVSIVLFRMLTSPQKSKMPFVEVAYWIGVMVALEVATDWFKYMCVIKFNPIDGISTLTHYKQIHMSDILHAKTPLRRMNFMPTPLAVIVLVNIMLPNLVGSEPLALWTYRFLVLSALLLAKLIIDWILLGSAAQSEIPPLPDKLLHVRAL